jgi:hypothetical protein
MPPHDLMEVLRRLQGEAVEALVPSGDEAQSAGEDADTNRRFQLGYETCEQLGEELLPAERFDRPHSRAPSSRLRLID